MLQFGGNWAGGEPRVYTAASAQYWAPSAHNTLLVNVSHIIEKKRMAHLFRDSKNVIQMDTLKRHLVRAELDDLAREHRETVEELLGDLEATRQLAEQHNGAHPAPRTPEGLPQDYIAPSATSQASTYTVTIVHGDPSFTVDNKLNLEFLDPLYRTPHMWLPSFGPWYNDMTSNALQRRVFPSRLRGNANLKNSTSHKLMLAVLDVLDKTTEDFFVDTRHVSDTNAAMCLLNGYYCATRAAPLPRNVADLWANVSTKLAMLVEDLKAGATAQRGFSFVYSQPRQRETIAPINTDRAYAPDFFSNHALFQLLDAAGLFLSKSKPLPPGATDVPDTVFIIASTIFGPDVHPFFTHQWNLRVGLAALEALILLYVLLDGATLPLYPSGQPRRLNLRSLLGNDAVPQRAPTQIGPVPRRSQAFDFLVTHYVLPTLQHSPNAPISALFPGIVLLALEARHSAHKSTNQPFINLSGQRFVEIFDVVVHAENQQSPQELLRARTTLRLEFETGLSLILSRSSINAAAKEILQTQFGCVDGYDLIYFMVLGYIPVTVAVV